MISIVKTYLYDETRRHEVLKRQPFLFYFSGMSWWSYTNARRHAHTHRHLKYAHNTSDSSTFEVLHLWRAWVKYWRQGALRSHDVRGNNRKQSPSKKKKKHRVDISVIVRPVSRNELNSIIYFQSRFHANPFQLLIEQRQTLVVVVFSNGQIDQFYCV